jgi:hypothetical protein
LVEGREAVANADHGDLDFLICFHNLLVSCLVC